MKRRSANSPITRAFKAGARRCPPCCESRQNASFICWPNSASQVAAAGNSRCIHFADEVGKGLKFAHFAGARHLRPHEIFVIPTNRAPARAAEESTRSDSVCSAVTGKSLRVDPSASLGMTDKDTRTSKGCTGFQPGEARSSARNRSSREVAYESAPVSCSPIHSLSCTAFPDLLPV